MMPGDPRSKKIFRLDLETMEMMPLVIWETDSSGRVLPGAAGGGLRKTLSNEESEEDAPVFLSVIDSNSDVKQATEQVGFF